MIVVVIIDFAELVIIIYLNKMLGPKVDLQWFLAEFVIEPAPVFVITVIFESVAVAVVVVVEIEVDIVNEKVIVYSVLLIFVAAD